MTQKIPVSSSLKENIDYLNQLFQKDITVKIRQFSNVENSDIRMCVFFVDGLTSEEFISEDIIAPIMHTKQLQEGTDLFVTVRDRVLIGCNISCSDDMSELLTSFLRGDAILLTDGHPQGIIISAKNWTIAESEHRTICAKNCVSGNVWRIAAVPLRSCRTGNLGCANITARTTLWEALMEKRQSVLSSKVFENTGSRLRSAKPASITPNVSV